MLDDFLNSQKIPILLSLVGLVLIAGGVYLSRPQPKPQAAYPKESMVQGIQLSLVKVDISGAVNHPGVYPISSNARVEDVVRLAGGFSDSSNSDYISKYFNLSQKISDGMKVYVPFSGESSGGVAGGGSLANSKVGLNSGSEKELEALPGIGPVSAQNIIDGRPYNSIDDLLNKKVVSKSVYGKIKDQVDLH